MNHKQELDIDKNRKVSKYSKKELVLRILWGGAQYLFRFSPRTAHGWRCFLLRLFGAKVGRNVHIYNNAIIYMPWNLEIGDWSAIGEWALIYNLGKVNIGSKTTLSHKTHICAGTHDYDKAHLPLVKRSIDIGSQAWVCSEVFVGPGVCVGEGAILGARSVVVKNVKPWVIIAGNPAKYIKDRKIVDG